jgi:ribonuclease HI
MHKIEWSWVKAHSGILLNECADILATKGVFNEPTQSLVQFLVPIGEDTDAQEYEMREGEETPVEGWRGEKKRSVRML